MLQQKTSNDCKNIVNNLINCKLVVRFLASCAIIAVFVCYNYLQSSFSSAAQIISSRVRFTYPHQNQQRQQPILIVSEGRSGSSFTLELLGSGSLSLTHFEPLQGFVLNDQFILQQQEQFGNKNKTTTTTAEDVIQDFFNCRFGSVFESILLERNPAYVWNICWNEKKEVVYGDDNDNSLPPEGTYDNDICYNLTALQDTCKLFPVQVIKEIRLPLSRAQQLFTRIDNLRVIYLVRDPRAIFHSHRKLEWQTTPKSLCGKLGSDYDQVVRLLHSQFRDRFTVLRYEDLAMRPVATARQLFDWLRLPWLPQVSAFIADHSAKDSNGNFSTFRRRGSRIASWINNNTTAANWKDIEDIQIFCQDMMQAYGYLNIHQQMINNRSSLRHQHEKNNHGSISNDDESSYSLYNQIVAPMNLQNLSR